MVMASIEFNQLTISRLMLMQLYLKKKIRIALELWHKTVQVNLLKSKHVIRRHPSFPSECCFSEARTLQGSHQGDHAKHSYQSLDDGSSCIHSKTHSVPVIPPNSQSPKRPLRTPPPQSGKRHHFSLPRALQRLQIFLQ
ncbi:hypothetical protein F8388_010451 [Cannabis sativa]|uniref:Uncharacterized protein n=1 Tax=Cannabis sativa TaxID=3483 RepID=A0A7J6GSL0_CANSA|nr:hypothetical protein F8388_010451 [Cannabis sativa]KAF4397371.1 hypothetical protein G4B88_027111 [Cannabis sativa]